MIKMPEIIALNGRTFTPIAQTPLPAWNSATSEHPIPTLTLKDDDLFSIADLLGNISGTSSLSVGKQESLGLFCRDTRFLSRLELQIDGKLPALLSSDAQKGALMTVLCANPQLNGRVRAETIAIEREIVLNGALFEDIKLTNYNTENVSFTISITFEADFLDLFEIRGYQRDKRGTLLRVWNEESTDNQPPEITLAYLGLDNVFMESRILFSSRQPDEIVGSTAIWHLDLKPHQNASLTIPLLRYTRRSIYARQKPQKF
jgi:glycogen debranching enzyme